MRRFARSRPGYCCQTVWSSIQNENRRKEPASARSAVVRGRTLYTRYAPGRRHSWRWPAPSSGFHSGYCSRPSGSNNPAGCGQTAALHPPRDRPPVPPKEKRQFLVKSENNYYLCEPKGEVQEWLNWPAWKASKPLKGFRGSNPLLSAG